MTESNVPAIPERTPTREVATTDTDSWVNIAGPIIHLAERIADTEFVPKGLRGSAPATAAAMLYGREVGLPPMTALNVTHVIEGKPGIEAEAMRALVFAAGHELEFVEATGALCTMRGRRAGQEKWTELSWSIDAARAAGLTGKSNWKSYPRAMLVARATTDLCRMIFPDVIHGFRTVEELGDLDGTEPTAQPQSGRKVSRTRKAAAAATAPAPALPAAEAPPERPVPTGPPLPGEDGYEAHEQPAGGDAAEGEAAEPDPPAGDDSPGNLAAGVEKGGEGPDEPSPPDRRGPRKAGRAQHRMIFATLKDLGVDDDRDERLLIASTIVGRDVTSFDDLTAADASKIIDTLALVQDKAGLNELLDTFTAES